MALRLTLICPFPRFRPLGPPVNLQRGGASLCVCKSSHSAMSASLAHQRQVAAIVQRSGRGLKFKPVSPMAELLDQMPWAAPLVLTATRTASLTNALLFSPDVNLRCERRPVLASDDDVWCSATPLLRRFDQSAMHPTLPFFWTRCQPRPRPSS